MPYALQPAGKNLYYVVTPDGRRMSRHPMPHERAVAQMRALYYHMRHE